MQITISDKWTPKQGAFASRGITISMGPEDDPALAAPSQVTVDKTIREVWLQILRFRYKIGNISQEELKEAMGRVQREYPAQAG